MLQRQIFNAFLANPWLNGLIIARAADRHHPVVPPRHPAVSRSGLGQRLPQRRSEACREAGAQIAGADGGDARRRAGRSRRHLGADHARLSQLAGDAARRGARHFALSHRAFGVPRSARHVLGPDRDRGFGRHHHQRPQDRRRRRHGVRGAQGRAGRAARRHGHFILVVAVRARRLAGARIPRFADQPGAEPLLHQSGRLARHHGAGRRHDERRRGAARRHPRRFERLRHAVEDGGGSKATTVAMANLAEAIQGLVQHMRSEQQMIRDWADEQAKLNRDLRRFMEQVAREPVER